MPFGVHCPDLVIPFLYSFSASVVGGLVLKLLSLFSQRAKPLKRAPVATFTSGSDVIHARKKNVTVRSATQGVTQGTALVISQKSQLGGAMDEQMVYKCKSVYSK